MEFGLFLKWSIYPRVSGGEKLKGSAVKSEPMRVNKTGVTSAQTGEDTEADDAQSVQREGGGVISGGKKPSGLDVWSEQSLSMW